MAKVDYSEEHYVLRVNNPELANRLRRGLRDEEDLGGKLQLKFTENGREGTLTVDGETYPVHVLDLPTTVESYKSLDDMNLVKSGDVGQILLVGTPSTAQQAEIDKAKATAQAQAARYTIESVDGITPPMRSARARHLRPRVEVPPHVMSQVEDALIDILEGAAPANTTFVDVEEEYVVDAATGRGSWQPVAGAGAEGKHKAEGGGRKSKAAAAAAAAAPAATS